MQPTRSPSGTEQVRQIRLGHCLDALLCPLRGQRLRLNLFQVFAAVRETATALLGGQVTYCQKKLRTPTVPLTQNIWGHRTGEGNTDHHTQSSTTGDNQNTSSNSGHKGRKS